MARDISATIAALIAKADRTDNQAEKDAYYAKAEEMRRAHNLEQEAIIARDPNSVTPTYRMITLLGHYSDLTQYYRRVFRSIVEHCGIRAYTEHTNGNLVAHCVGYESDLNYAEFLWTAAYMMFSTRIDPRWDDSLPEDENIWRMRNAGTKRATIADRAWGDGAGLESKNRNKVQRVYLAECAKRGEDAKATGLGHQADVYRVSYARGFADEFDARLYRARQAVNTSGGVLTMHGRAERVDEAFYTRYPTFRPRPETASEEPIVYTPCPKCQKAQTGACRDHRVPAAAIKRWDRMNNSRSAASGSAAGRQSASHVLIQRGAKTGELES